MTPGQTLKQTRIQSGKSLEQLSASTKIHIKILNAIEEDRYSELPAKAFTRGFIVSYAKALKLNADALLKEHHDFLEARFAERTARDQGHHGYAFEGKELEQNRRWTWIALALAGGFALAVLIVFKPGNHKSKEKYKEYAATPSASPAIEENASEPSPAIAALNPESAPMIPATSATSAPIVASAASTPPSPQTSVATPSPVANAAATPAPTQSATPEPQTTPSPQASPSPSPDKLNKGDDLSPQEAKIKLIIVATEDAWTRYRSDDKPLGMLILRAGKTLVIKAKGRVLFETNPSAKLQFKTRKSPLADLPASRIEMTEEGVANSYSGNELGKNPLSDTIPPPRAQ